MATFSRAPVLQASGGAARVVQGTLIVVNVIAVEHNSN
jgi:hypothetical protein